MKKGVGWRQRGGQDRTEWWLPASVPDHTVSISHLDSHPSTHPPRQSINPSTHPLDPIPSKPSTESSHIPKHRYAEEQNKSRSEAKSKKKIIKEIITHTRPTETLDGQNNPRGEHQRSRMRMACYVHESMRVRFMTDSGNGLLAAHS